MGNESPKSGQNQGKGKEMGGGGERKRSPRPAQDDQEDIYILEKLQNISLKPKNTHMYFWVDPKIFSSENQKYETFLKKYLHLESFSSVEGLQNFLADMDPNRKFKVICAASLNDQDYKRLEADSRATAMFLFCQNQQRAKLLRSNFPKIKAAKFDIIELKDTILQMEDADSDSVPKTNMLLMIEDDTNLMNKYRINFYSLTCKYSEPAAKKDFVNLAKRLYPEQGQAITQFDSEYKIDLSGDAKTQQTLSWIGKGNFFLESTQQLPKITTDPKTMGYLRFPFKECYEAISQHYKSKPKKVGELYMVLTPNAEQLEKLRDNVNNYIIFTSFAKAYTTEKAANKTYKSNSNSFLIRIMLPSMTGKIIDSLDFGYWINASQQDDKPNVVFNIYNVFKILEFEEDIREGTLQYGSLADVAFKRQRNRDTYRLTPHEEHLIRNYDYLEDIISRINSQATILQMSGYFKESIEVYDRKFQYIRKSQPSQDVIDKHAIEMGDVYRMNEDYKLAEEQYQSVKGGKMHLIALVHLAELYFKTHENAKLEKVINQIEKNLERYKQISNPEAFKAQNYIGMELMNRGKHKEAHKLYKQLIGDVAKHYDYKFEGIPLVHDIFRNRAACETKLNNFQQALSLLDSTKSWQKICEGSKSPGLLITENLIKSVHMSRGSNAQLKQSEAQIKKIKKSVDMGQNIYLSRSTVMVNLDQSTFHIDTSVPQQQPQKKQQQPAQNIQQSAINIQTTAPKENINIKESAINIDI